ncbi:ComEA family DNA-binding protein [Segetibacter koreensis]|uniref:ComEA family DNA-binding protein n=1 Tax=Segetibacter koreensis TaxID=398037 RepID=UPI000371489B|nr:helix-hairpin-helix domain-containing protein [Segetibacter koreensis]
MRKKAVILLIAFWSSYAYSQEEGPTQPGSIAEQQLENITEQQEAETEDDSYLQQLVQLHRNPININTAQENELRDLRILSDLQIQSLLRYRRLLGNFISIYELQAVPLLDLETIQQILPDIRVGNAVAFSADIKDRLVAGQHSFLFRAQQLLEKSDGFTRNDTVSNRYMGSAQRLFFRYKYVYRNLLQFGLTGDKDAGEAFFKGKQKYGFDFYSFHLFARKLGAVKMLALGDFAVNLGQGLIQWQSLAFKKSADITAIKRQADILRPYNSAGEYNFMRGAGITAGGKNTSVTAFASVRKLDATFNDDTSQMNRDFVSSIATSGYHRTPNENAKKNIVTQASLGGNVSYNKNSFHVGLNVIAFKFSIPLIRDVQPYNQYAIQGKEWYNYSLDYSYTFRNFHFFGEAAMDKRKSKAFIGGIIASLDPKVDASVLYRNIEKTYQALNGNAFTESTLPTNEKGLFTGISIKPVTFLKIDAYADIFSFPWLRYRVDAPSNGTEYLLQLTYKPNKQFELYSRLRNENKAINVSRSDLPTIPVYTVPRINWRIQSSNAITKAVTLRERIELLWFDTQQKDRMEHGLLSYFEAVYKPFNKPLSLNGRLQYFKTDSSESGLYAFESDVLYSYSIPQFTGQGLRYYLNVNYDFSKKMAIWFRWAQTIYTNKSLIGASLNQIRGNKRSEVKIQVLYDF